MYMQHDDAANEQQKLIYSTCMYMYNNDNDDDIMQTLDVHFFPMPRLGLVLPASAVDFEAAAEVDGASCRSSVDPNFSCK